MKRKEQRNAPLKRKGNILNGKSLFICFIVIVTTLTSEFSCVNLSEGKVSEESTINFAYDKSCFRMVISENLAYLYLLNFSEELDAYENYIEIVNLESIQIPEKMGRYHLELNEFVLKMEVRDHLLYVLSMVSASVQTLALTIINVAIPSQPWEVGRYQEENVSIPHDFTVYKDYCYLCTETEMKIISLTNLTNPILIEDYPQPSYFVKNSDDLLFLGYSAFQVYNISNLEKPALLGELTNGSGKGSLVSIDILDNYFYAGFQWDGLCSYNFKDSTNPVMWSDYSFPKREIYSGGQIQDIVVSGNRLFACGYGLYIFGLGTPRWIRRIVHKNIDAYAYEIAEENGLLYINTWDSIKIYSYKEYAVAISLGVTGVVVIPIIVFFVIRYRKQKMFIIN